MVDNGLSIDEAEFMKLKPKEQMCVVYRNTSTTVGLVKKFKFHQKIQYLLVGLLTTGVLVLLQMHLR